MEILKNWNTDDLRAIPVLAGLGDDGWAHLASVAEVRSYDIAETVLTVHEESEHVYFILKGGVQIQVPGKGFVGLGQGGFFGEGALVEEDYFLPPGWRLRTRSATIVSLKKDTELAVFQYDQFSYVLQKYPDVRWAIAEEAKRRPGNKPS